MNALHDNGDVVSVIDRLFPELKERRVAMEQLVASADYANAVAPAAWGAALHQNFFRLNVGQVEVLVVGNGVLRLNCLGMLGDTPFVGTHFEQTAYKSIRNPHCAYVGPLDEYPSIAATLHDYHRAFIEAAGRTKSGTPRSGSPHVRSHSRELMAYARWFADRGMDHFLSPDEISQGNSLLEGAGRWVIVNAYERNPEARRQCISTYGTDCCICGFRFGDVYGPEAEGYIHVHHLRPLSEVGGTYVVDPERDLRPVCPNCHAVLHLGKRCRSIEEVQQLFRRNRV
jgi:hypothetical protein